MSVSKTELVTRSKRPGMDCTIDIFHEKTRGFSKNINDRTTYKMVLVDDGSFVVEEDGEYKTIVAPAFILLNEKADFSVISEDNIRSRTIFFRPNVIRDEFTIEALNSGKYDKFLSAVGPDAKMDNDEDFQKVCFGDTEFEDCFSKEMVYQDALLLTMFCKSNRNIHIYSLFRQEYDMGRRLFGSVEYELNAQPDNFWILRTRYFVISILFTAAADFYRNYRHDEIYSDPLVAKVSRYFWENIDQEITLDTILKNFSVNKNTLNAAFKEEVGMSCMNYLEKLRMNLAQGELQFSKATISEISQLCGYSDTNYFSRVFKKHFDMTPSEYRDSMSGLC